MMKRLIALILAAVLLCSSACAEAAVSAPVQGNQLSLEDIAALNSGMSTAYFQNGQLTFLDGACTSDPIKSMEDASLVLDSMLCLLGGDEDTHFEPWRVLNDSFGNVYYVFQQTYADMIVLGGAVKIITGADGKMLGLTGSVTADLPDVDEAEGQVTAEQAEEVAVQHEMQAQHGDVVLVEGATRKIVLPVSRELDLESDKLDTRFVWAVYTTTPLASVSAGTELPYLAHYVSLAGEYLYSLPTILPGDAASRAGYDANYVFQFMEPAEYVGYVDMADGSEQEITVTLMRDSRTGMYYLGNIEHKIVVADCWEFLYNGGRVILEYSPDNLEWDQVGLKSLYNYCRAYDYYKEIGWNGGDGKETPIIILKDYCDPDHTPVDNACYAGEFFGWQCFLSSAINSFSECLDVIAHEYTHCVTGSVMTYNAYMNDFGAINEAMSDIQGNLCEMLLGATEDETWLLGEKAQTVRSMSAPHLYGQPEYSWDLYYQPNVKTPTDINDRGGVHTNSSLLNNLAYRLCVNGGMPLADARTFWFAVDCAMVPGTDYAQLRALLPWVLKITALDAYQDALAEAIQATRLGNDAMPEVLAENQALLTLNLPDNEIFNNGNWMLSVVSVNVEKLKETVTSLIGKAITGDTGDLPKVVQFLLSFMKPQPTPMPAPTEEKEGFWKTFLRVLAEELAEEEKTKEEKISLEEDDLKELIQWLRNIVEEVFYSGNVSAGQDGHTITMMSLPGRTIPYLMYVAVKPGSSTVEQMNMVVYLDHQWIDVTEWVSALTNQETEDQEDQWAEFFESCLFDEILEIIRESGAWTDYLDALTLNVPGGQVFEIPAAGLEKIDLSSNIAPLTENAAENKVVNKKSRPKLPEAEGH